MSDADPRWEGDRVQRWLALADSLERQLAPVSDLLFTAAALQPGERVLDVGCGTGPTTRQAAAEVGSEGSVVGLDVAADMLAAAASTALPEGTARVDWLEADAGVEVRLPEPADVVLSRFGVMFFDDPAAAFANLAGATRPGGRLAIATWARRDRSPMFEVPLSIVLDVVAAAGMERPELPVDEGPFSLSEPDEVAALLAGAGWSDVTPEVHVVSLSIGGGAPPEAAAHASVQLGPAQRALDGAPQDVTAEVIRELTDVYQRHLDGQGHVALDGTILITTARRD